MTRVMIDSVFGQVSYFYALIPFLNVILTMGLATGFFRYADQCRTPLEKRELFTTTWGAVSTFSMLFFVGCCLFSGSLSELLEFGAGNSWYVVAVAALIAIDNIAAIPLASLRQRGRAGFYTVVNVTGVAVNIILFILLYSYIPGARSEPGWVLVANIGASLVSLLMMAPDILRQVTPRVSIPLLRSILLYSIPLMLAGLMGTASDFIDRQMLRWMLPSNEALAAIGQYSAVAKIAALMVIFRQIYALGAEPFFLQKFQKQDFLRMNADALKMFWAAGLALFLGVTLFSDLFGLLLGSDFRVAMNLVPMLLIANLLSGVIVNLSFWYKVADKTRYAIYVTLIGVVATVALNWILIPLWGYQGSAVARVAATLAMVIVSYIYGRRNYPVPYDLKALARYGSLAATIYILSLGTSTLGVVWHYSANFLLLLCYLYYVVKSEKLWKLLKS